MRAAPQRRDQRRLVDHLAARDIDQQADGFIAASAAASISPSVSGVSGQVSATMSAPRQRLVQPVGMHDLVDALDRGRAAGARR